jgi:hypothetical protein
MRLDRRDVSCLSSSRELESGLYQPQEDVSGLLLAPTPVSGQAPVDVGQVILNVRGACGVRVCGGL